MNIRVTLLVALYTIGGVSPDFPTFDSAVSLLKTCGIDSSVIFDVRDGTYTEQISIGAIPGSSSSNTVTFRSESGDSTAVILTWPSSTLSTDPNYTLGVHGVDYIRFEHMTIERTGSSTYARVVEIDGYSFGVVFRGNIIQGVDLNSTSDASALVQSLGNYNDDADFYHNRFLEGSYGIYLYRGSIAPSGIGPDIEYNDFEGQYYMAIRLHGYPQMDIQYNTINLNEYTVAYGMYLHSCNSLHEIEGNEIYLSLGGRGIYMFDCVGISSIYSQIFSNFISIGGGSSAYGVWLDGATQYQRIGGNNIEIYSTNTSTGRGIYHTASAAGHDIYNNNVVNRGGGYCIYVSTIANISNSNYNNFYATGTNIGYDGTANRATLANWQGATGDDANSISSDPLFVIPGQDLHIPTTSPAVDAGIYYSSNPFDIDRDTRGSGTTDIGADENSCPAALAGTYTIGGTTPDYNTFQEAVDALMVCGVSGPVVFDVRDGTYTEQIIIPEIAGSSTTNTITFQSETGDSSAVVLTWPSSINNYNNYTIYLLGADNFIFTDLTIERTGTSLYGRVINLEQDALNNTFTHNILRASLIASTSTGGIVLYADNNGIYDDLNISNNSFQQGTYGLYINSSATTSSDVIIADNDFSDFYYMGMRLAYVDECDILRNTINNNAYFNAYGMYLSNCDGQLEIQDNYINLVQGRYGLTLFSCVGNGVSYSPIVNNMVIVGGASTAYGIRYSSGTAYVTTQFNTVEITSTSTTAGYAFRCEASAASSMTGSNNILVNSGGGYSTYIANPSVVWAFNYNDLYATGTNLGYYNAGQ